MNEANSNKLLLKLAGFLWNLPKERFDYSHWVGWNWKGATDLSCGTTACALGWAATMPEFNAVGLGIVRGLGIRNLTKALDDQTSDPVLIASDILGLRITEARLLFVPLYHKGSEWSPNYDAGPRTVSRHIRRFVARRMVSV